MNQRQTAADSALRPVTNAAQPVVLSGGEWDRMTAQAKMLVESGFLPPALNTAQKAVAVALTGQELGIPMMLALRTIHIIEGKPTLSADLMASLVLREIDRHGDGLLLVMPPTAQQCTVRYRRWGNRDTLEYTYTIKDAERANLAGRATWKAHPAAMLRARAVSAVCRMAFPDVVAGLYTPDELLADSEPIGETGAAEDGPPPDLMIGFTERGDWRPVDEAEVIDAETGEILDPNGPVNDGQLLGIKALVADLGIEDTFAPYMQAQYGAEETTELTWNQANEMIQRMQQKLAERAEKATA